jgi:hypothetical protein
VRFDCEFNEASVQDIRRPQRMPGLQLAQLLVN